MPVTNEDDLSSLSKDMDTILAGKARELSFEQVYRKAYNLTINRKYNCLLDLFLLKIQEAANTNADREAFDQIVKMMRDVFLFPIIRRVGGFRELNVWQSADQVWWETRRVLRPRVIV